MIIRESTQQIVHTLDNETLLDLIVNAIYFDEKYLNDKVLSEFPTVDSLNALFSQDQIVAQLAKDKEISREDALDRYIAFLDKHYGAYDG